LKDLLLGIDIGTTGTKSAVFTFSGKLLSSGQSDYGMYHEHPGWAEQNPEDWWDAVRAATRKSVSEVREGPERIAGIAVSSQAPTLLPLDRSGKVVRPALIWMDRRSESEAQELRRICGEGVIERVTGNRPDPFYVASKILWYRTHEPERFAKTALFVQANGYINYRLTGLHSMDNVHAALLQLRDYDTGEWSNDLCGCCGIEPAKFPPVYHSHHVFGEVTRKAAEETGLLHGTPVMAGTVDGAAAALEAGASGSGTAAEMTGTSTVLIIPADRKVTEPVFIAMPHCIPEKYLLLGAMAASGVCLRWFRDRFGTAGLSAGSGDKTDAYDLLTGEASLIRPGSGGVIFLPYMMGERSPIWHTNARGVFFGLNLSTDRGTMVRSILEGTAFALLHNVETARRAGIKLEEIRSVGGGTRSELWNQIKADVLGIPILLPETSVGAAFGDAMLAGIGLDIYKDIEEALRTMVKIRARYEPDSLNHHLYRKLYSVFRNIYEHLRDDFDVTAGIDGV
jgi:xylulokinase